jgi:hypothetical protein
VFKKIRGIYKVLQLTYFGLGWTIRGWTLRGTIRWFEVEHNNIIKAELFWNSWCVDCVIVIMTRLASSDCFRAVLKKILLYRKDIFSKKDLYLVEIMYPFIVLLLILLLKFIWMVGDKQNTVMKIHRIDIFYFVSFFISLVHYKKRIHV